MSFIDTRTSSSRHVWSQGNKSTSHRENLLCIRNPWFTRVSPRRTALYGGINGVTSRQCQGEGNVSVHPRRAFFFFSFSFSPPRSVFYLVNDSGVASVTSARSEVEELADCNHRQSSPLPVDFLFFFSLWATLDWDCLAPDVWFELHGRARHKENMEREKNKDL